MNHDEQREETQRQDTARRQQEEDPRRFEKITREVRQEQSPRTGEEGTEEDRRQWEKTRDIRKEASEIPEEAHGRTERTPEGQEHSREERKSGGPGDD
jgi:hypothetical protein